MSYNCKVLKIAPQNESVNCFYPGCLSISVRNKVMVDYPLINDSTIDQTALRSLRKRLW